MTNPVNTWCDMNMSLKQLYPYILFLTTIQLKLLYIGPLPLYKALQSAVLGLKWFLFDSACLVCQAAGAGRETDCVPAVFVWKWQGFVCNTIDLAPSPLIPCGITVVWIKNKVFRTCARHYIIKWLSGPHSPNMVNGFGGNWLNYWNIIWRRIHQPCCFDFTWMYEPLSGQHSNFPSPVFSIAFAIPEGAMQHIQKRALWNDWYKCSPHILIGRVKPSPWFLMTAVRVHWWVGTWLGRVNGIMLNNVSLDLSK